MEASVKRRAEAVRHEEKRSSSLIVSGSLVKGVGRYLLRCSYRYQVTYIRNRGDLPHILNARKLLSEGAEIGVQSGYFSEVILNAWRGTKLYSIDPWQEYPPTHYVDVANVLQSEQDRRYQQTVERLKRFGSRSSILRKISRAAVDEFKDGQLDFVYLDAQHHYEAVTEDLTLWRPKIRQGGLLAGHDYVDGDLPQGVFGVKSAVDEFVRANCLRLVVSREAHWTSWFVFV